MFYFKNLFQCFPTLWPSFVFRDGPSVALKFCFHPMAKSPQNKADQRAGKLELNLFIAYCAVKTNLSKDWDGFKRNRTFH